MGVSSSPRELADCVLGIDTGGTYTDGALLDYHTRKVIASAKSLTTYEDLSKGIHSVLEKLSLQSPGQVKLVGISSTLATNSIAEGNIKAVGLLLIGYDRQLLQEYDLESSFATSHFAYFRGGHTAQGKEQAPLDVEGIVQWVRNNSFRLEALAISSYFSPLNPEHEEEALRALREFTDIPVVLGHQLSTRLDSVRRAATASLNASLVAVMHDFIQAVRSSLQEAGFKAPLMIVKGDGSLMPFTEAVNKPVETVLSGPAASAIGGRFLSGCNGALVVDVGGTTTDMALVEEGSIAVTEEGALVGAIRTAVKAARIRTVCIGCDSRIYLKSQREFQVGPERVVPLSRLVSLHPELEEEVLSVGTRRRKSGSQADVEYFFLAREVSEEDPLLLDPKKKALLDLLRDRPFSLHDLLGRMGVNHSVQLGVEELMKRGVVGLSALTPTDLLHFQGELDIGHGEAASRAFKHICSVLDCKPADLAERIMENAVSRICEEAVVFLARQGEGKLPEQLEGEWAEWFFRQAMIGDDARLSVSLSSRYPVIGIGAPAKKFVRWMAKKLHSRFVLPDHPHVANAVGAVAGSVIVDKEALLYVRETEKEKGYIVQFEGRTNSFPELEEALSFARRSVQRAANEAAEEAGAEDPKVRVEQKMEGGLQRIQARAVGNPRLAEQFG